MTDQPPRGGESVEGDGSPRIHGVVVTFERPEILRLAVITQRHAGPESLDDFRMIVERLVERVQMNAAESLGEREMMLRCEVLVADIDDMVLQPGAVDLVEGIVVDRLRQVDPANFRAERAGEPMHLDLLVP